MKGGKGRVEEVCDDLRPKMGGAIYLEKASGFSTCIIRDIEGLEGLR